MQLHAIRDSILEEISKIQKQTLDDIDLAIQAENANHRAKRRCKDRFGNFRRHIVSLFEKSTSQTTGGG